MGKPFSFCDGLTLNPGTRIAFSLDAAQRDADQFQNPCNFDGFRFFDLDKQDARNEDLVRRWGAANASMTNLVYVKRYCFSLFPELCLARCRRDPVTASP